MSTTRFSTLLVLPATLWLAASVIRTDEDCTITRPGGVKEPGVTNNKGECCSSFYADDCVPPAHARLDGNTILYFSVKTLIVSGGHPRNALRRNIVTPQPLDRPNWSRHGKPPPFAMLNHVTADS